MKNYFSKPLFWIIFSSVTILSIAFTFRYFSDAFSIISVDIKMDRAQALSKAQTLANAHSWLPAHFSQAAEFATDSTTKTFIELDGGGVKALREIMDAHLFMPYTWHVRHFKEFDAGETDIYFTPDGTPYGFKEQLPEDLLKPNVSSEQAEAIARTAAQEWKVDLTPYKIIEHAEQTRPNNRIDHTIVYERTDAHIAAGFYRLTIVVSGDTLTQFQHSVKVPQDFELRYKEMRSANEGIAAGASMAMILLYFIGGCIFGFIFLARRRYLVWKPALRWGIIIALLMICANINQLPMLWIKYNTAIPATSFLIQYFVSFIQGFAAIACLCTIVFITAEGLTRAAFGSHLKFWRLWSEPISHSKEMLGRTVGGYFLAAIDIAFVVGFYLIATSYFGWWTPSEQLMDPNILATYFPWVSTISLALFAGFFEECMFRAIPLAGAALLGDRWGKRRLFIIVALIAQAIIFGAAHANYPAMPAYARLVEMMLPSLAYGILYLRFGLLTVIIIHVIYDTILMSLPLFVSKAPDAWMNQSMVILLACTPLIIILISRLRARAWITAPADAYNNAWHPAPSIESHEAPSAPIIPLIKKLGTRRWFFVFGIVGILGWALCTQFISDAPAIHLNRTQAIEKAREEFAKRNITFDTHWTPLANLASTINAQTVLESQQKYVWQIGGKKLYHDLLGIYLRQPHWIVRFVRFNGTVAERAQEYQCYITTTGICMRTIHKLADTQAGASLDETAAKKIALSYIAQHYQINPDELMLMQAEPKKQLQRIDWRIDFARTNNHELKKDSLRISVNLAGDEVIDSFRYVHVPQQWEREQKKIKHAISIASTSSNFLFYLFIILALLIVSYGFKSASSWQMTAGAFAIVFALLSVNLINNIPWILAQFNTSEPFSNQLFTLLGILSIFVLLMSAVQGSIIGLTVQWQTFARYSNFPVIIVMGICLGTALAGLRSVIMLFQPSIEPLWANYSSLDAAYPLLASVTLPISAWISLTMMLLLLFSALDTLTRDRNIHFIARMLIIVAATSMMTGYKEIESIPFWLISGALLGVGAALLYELIVRYDNRFIPPAAAGFFCLQLIQQGMFNAIPNAMPQALIACGILLVLSVCWSRLLYRPIKH